MIEPIINYDDLDEDMYGGSLPRYKGELFTGTVFYDDTNPVSYTEYKEGEENGRSVSYHRNGQLEEDAIYIEGKYISGKHWYDNGQLRYDSENNHTILDEDGLITRKDATWFYKNGNIRCGNGGIFSSEGRLAALIEPSDVIINNYPTNRITYYHSILVTSFQELQENIYLDGEDNANYRGGVEVLLRKWIITLSKNKNKDLALSILGKMIINSQDKLKLNLHYRVKHLEENFIHNSKIFLKELEKDEFEVNPLAVQNNLSVLIFD